MNGFLKVRGQSVSEGAASLRAFQKAAREPDFGALAESRQVEAVQEMTAIGQKDLPLALAAVETMYDLRSSKRPAVRREAACGLGSLGWQYEDAATDALGALMGLSGDDDASVRRDAVDNAGVIAARHGRLARLAFMLFSSRVADHDVIVRREVASRTGLICSHFPHLAGRGETLLSSLAGDCDASVRQAVRTARAAIDRACHPDQDADLSTPQI